MTRKPNPKHKSDLIVGRRQNLEDVKPSSDIAYISLKYFDSKKETLSDWQKKELDELTEYFNKVNRRPWPDILRDTELQVKQHQNSSSITGLDETVKLLEMRISKKARVHGFRQFDAFHLVLLDRNHAYFLPREGLKCILPGI